jgi:hypothetical protein
LNIYFRKSVGKINSTLNLTKVSGSLNKDKGKGKGKAIPLQA